MAKITVDFDTVTKEATIAIDGKPLENVNGVGFSAAYDDPDEFECHIRMAAKNEEHDMTTYTSLCASLGVELEFTSLHSQIAKYFE